jgi:hypothetical protein
MNNSVQSSKINNKKLSPVPFLPIENLNTTSNVESPRLNLPEVTEKPLMDTAFKFSEAKGSPGQSPTRYDKTEKAKSPRIVSD